MKLKKQSVIIEEIAEEVADLIVDSKKLSDVLKTSKEKDVIQKRNLSEVTKMKERIRLLENRVEKYIKSFKIVAVEVERMITERTEEMNKENEQQIMHLQGQIEDLRTIMIRIGNEVKKIKGI